MERKLVTRQPDVGITAGKKARNALVFLFLTAVKIER